MASPASLRWSVLIGARVIPITRRYWSAGIGGFSSAVKPRPLPYNGLEERPTTTRSRIPEPKKDVAHIYELSVILDPNTSAIIILHHRATPGAVDLFFPYLWFPIRACEPHSRRPDVWCWRNIVWKLKDVGRPGQCVPGQGGRSNRAGNVMVNYFQHLDHYSVGPCVACWRVSGCQMGVCVCVWGCKTLMRQGDSSY